MALHLVLLPMILAVSLATTECCASSPGSRMDLHLHSRKNASGHWIIRVNARRSLVTEIEREIIIDVHERTRFTANNELEQVVSMTTVYPPQHDTSMPGAIEPATTTPNTATPSNSTTDATTSSSTTTVATPSTSTTTVATTSTSTTTPATPSTAKTTNSTNTPKSCPHSGYELYPGYNCYKAFSHERKTWSEARQQCISDGGDLMVMDSERELEDVYLPLYKSVRWVIFKRFPWVGVYIPHDENDWKTVKGEPALSTWWQPAYPYLDYFRKCAYALSTGLLWNWECEVTLPFICEISL